MPRRYSRKKTLDHYFGLKPGKHLEESNLILLTLALLVVVGGLALYFSSQGAQEFQTLASEQKQIIGSVSVVFDFGKIRREFMGDIYSDTTLYAVIWQAVKVGKMQIHADTEKKFGHILLSGFNNQLNGKKGHWIFYVNSKRITGDINEILLKAGDKILVRYE